MTKLKKFILQERLSNEDRNFNEDTDSWDLVMLAWIMALELKVTGLMALTIMKSRVGLFKVLLIMIEQN